MGQHMMGVAGKCHVLFRSSSANINSAGSFVVVVVVLEDCVNLIISVFQIGWFAFVFPLSDLRNS